VEKRSISGAIFISPRPKVEPKYSWKSKTLKITLPDSFADSTTYIVTLGTALRDLRNNKIDNAYTFTFSTGDVINQGNISGLVFKDGKAASAVSVALFDYSVTENPKFDSLIPPYMTQTGKEGEFLLEYLNAGNYLVMAFEDKNKNQLFDYPDESFGLPDREAVVSDTGAVAGLILNLTRKDTAEVSIISTIVTQDNLVRVRFNRAVSAGIISGNLKDARLVSLNGEQLSFPVAAVKEAPIDTVTAVHLYFDSLSNGDYKIRLPRRIFTGDETDTVFLESSELSISLESDEVHPVNEGFSHYHRTVYPEDSIFSFYYSEPVMPLVPDDSVFVIYDSEDNNYKVSFDWRNPFRPAMTIGRLEWGKEYHIAVLRDRLGDLSGNILGDSAEVFTFATYDIDSLGEISGTIAYTHDTDLTVVPYLIFHGVDGAFEYVQSIDNEHFKTRLPGGKYFLSGFLDKNENGRHDPGSLIPWYPAETYSIYPDTIRVRPRFETSDINFEFK